MVIAWLVAQVLQLVFESFGTPDWVMKTVLVLLATGIPFVLFFAWAFEMTPEGLKRESEVDRSQSITPQTGRKLNNVITGILVLALGYFIVDKFVLDAARDAEMIEAAKQEVVEQSEVSATDTGLPVTQEADKSIAVLPFVNMSGDQENEYFSDGLTEELLNSLARIKELKVTGRTSSFAFKGNNTDLREIGQTLGVAHILEGSVRKAQNRVRITAQLVKTDDGYHMWSDTFDRELDDIFAIQEEIATRVAKALSSTLLGDSGGKLVHMGTNNTQAYEAYLRGRYLFIRNPDDAQVQAEADQLFSQALDLDPGFTLAWFGRFNVLSYRQRAGSIDYKDGATQMRQLADKMVEMDPDLSESYLASTRVSLVEMNWPKAEAAINRALLLNPGSSDVLSARSTLFAILNRNEEALEYAIKAQARDPLDIASLAGLAGMYETVGRCEDAKEIVTRALSLVPDASRFRGRLAHCWRRHHAAYEKAIDLYQQEPLGFIRLTGLAISYDKLGQKDKAQQYLDELIASEGVQASYQHAEIYAQWGDQEKALDALELAWDIGDAGIILLKRDTDLDPIRDQPRFISMMEKWEDPSKR